MLGERRNLVVPGLPEIGKAVDEDGERPAPLGDVVSLDAAGISEAVLAQARREHSPNSTRVMDEKRIEWPRMAQVRRIWVPHAQETGRG